MNLTTYCVVCRAEIPEKRAVKRAVTCDKKECGLTLKQIRRFRTNQRKCKICAKPSTPDERKDFQRWRRETKKKSEK